MQEAPKTFFERLKFIGPSVVVTGSVVGSGSIVMTPLLGAAAGFMLLWWLLLSMWSKPIIQAEIARYIVVSKKTFFRSFCRYAWLQNNHPGKNYILVSLVHVHWSHTFNCGYGRISRCCGRSWQYNVSLSDRRDMGCNLLFSYLDIVVFWVL